MPPAQPAQCCTTAEPSRPVCALAGQRSWARSQAKEQLSRVKRPVEFRIVTGLPQTSTGKVARRRLRELLVADTRRSEPVPL